MFISLISPKLTAQQSELYLLRKIIFILINIILIWDINDFLWEIDQSLLVDSQQTRLIRRINALIAIVFDCVGLILVYRLKSRDLLWFEWIGIIRLLVQTIIIGLGIISRHFLQERYIISQKFNFIITITVVVFQILDAFVIWLIFILLEFIPSSASIEIVHI